jgi:hypothetical protein
MVEDKTCVRVLPNQATAFVIDDVIGNVNLVNNRVALHGHRCVTLEISGCIWRRSVSAAQMRTKGLRSAGAKRNQANSEEGPNRFHIDQCSAVFERCQRVEEVVIVLQPQLLCAAANPLSGLTDYRGNG